MRTAFVLPVVLAAVLAASSAALADGVPPPPPPPPVAESPPADAPRATWTAPGPVPTPPAWVGEAPRPGAAAPVPPRAAPIAPAAPLVRRAVRVQDREAFRAWARSGCDALAEARGPAEIRDEWIPSQPRLTLPSVAPDVLRRGQRLLKFWVDWGNDFGFSQTGAAESPFADRRFLVDGEHLSIEAQARYGLGHGVDVGIRVPLKWRGGGYLDGLIEWWHDQFNLLNNARDEFYFDRYRVQGRDDAYNRYAWEDHGWGLGRVELDARWAFVQPCRRSDWRVAAIARVGLPTGTGAYETPGVDVGAQIVAAKQLWRRWDVYGGVGGTWYSDDTIDGFAYEPIRGHGFFAIEYRPLPYLSLLVQTDASTRLITNLTDYPSVQWYLYVGMKADLGKGWRLTVGITENLENQQSTIDFALWQGIEVVF